MTTRSLLSLALLCVACGSTSAPAPTAPTASVTPDARDPGPWSRAGRRARVRHAWHCMGQGVEPPADATVPAPGRPRSSGAMAPKKGPRRDDCDYLHYLCAEIAHGHPAWDTERDACARR